MQTNRRQTRSTQQIDSDTDKCDISLCGSPAGEHVEHPQRGEMVVCKPHARRIRALPRWRFIGSDDRWPEVAQ